MAAVTLTSEWIDRILAAAEERSRAEGEDLAARYPQWGEALLRLLSQRYPLTYLSVLLVALVARAADEQVDVTRIRPGDEYSASLVGQRLVQFGRAHEIDVRTDSTNVMNNQPFVRQPRIIPNLADTTEYADFFQMIQQAQQLTSGQASDVLALGMRLGRDNWPRRQRRRQRNQAHQLPPSSQERAYFVLNQSPLQQFAHYGDGAEYYGFHENVTSARALLDAGGGRFVLYRTSDAAQSPMCFVGSGVISSVEPDEVDDEGRARYQAHIEWYEEFARAVPKTQGAPAGWNVQNSISRISQGDFERIVSLGTGADATTADPMSLDDLRTATEAAGLLVAQPTLAALLAALDSGKHVMLSGPPGTGKTTLAVLVAELAAKRGHSEGTMVTTATADWSTYDTIGGLAPQSDGTLQFQRGRFLEAVAANQWLVVDELNRSNFDRAFGQLFTVLSGHAVLLPYRDPDTDLPVRIRPAHMDADSAATDVVVQPTWRMLATINALDKSLLFEMSYALMRRFAFVEVPAPPGRAYLDLAAREVVDDAPDVGAVVVNVVQGLLPLRQFRQIGPAAYLDAARMTRSLALGSSLTRQEMTLHVFYAMLLPQLEGLEDPDGQRLLDILRPAISSGLLPQARRMLREVLGLTLPVADEDAFADDAAVADLEGPDHEPAGATEPGATGTARSGVAGQGPPAAAAEQPTLIDP